MTAPLLPFAASGPSAQRAMGCIWSGVQKRALLLQLRWNTLRSSAAASAAAPSGEMGKTPRPTFCKASATPTVRRMAQAPAPMRRSRRPPSALPRRSGVSTYFSDRPEMMPATKISRPDSI